MTPTSAPERVSIVIVNWNAGDALAGTLQSVRDAPPPCEWDVVVVDNASSDGSVDRALPVLPQAKVIRNSVNRGLAAGNNQGIMATTAPFVLIANPDVVFQPGAIAALLDVLRRRPRAGFAIPRLRYPDGERQTSAGELPTLADALGGRQLQRRRAVTGAQGFWWDEWPHDEERSIGRGHEAAFLVRREAIEEFGLQDERFPLDWEGIDWSARARAAGWEIWFSPDADVVHLGGRSVRQVPARWVIGSHVGMYRYFAKRSRPAARPLLAAAFALRGVAKLIGVAARVADYERSYR